MSRSEYRKLFTAQGSAPLTNLHMLAPQRVQTDYDSQCRSNVVIMSGDAAQSKIHIPKVDPKARTPAAPLSAHSFLLLQACLTNQDFSCDVDLTTSFSASVSGAAPQLKKVGLRVSIGTFHGGGDAEGAKGAGGRAGGYRSVAVVGPRNETQQKGAPCRLPLLMHRGVWHTVVIDLEAIVCSHVESCDAFRDLVSPPDSARRAGKPRHLNIVLTGLLIDSLTLSGSCRFKEISTASDETAAMMLIRETRLPRHLIPEHALHGYDVQSSSPQTVDRNGRGANQPSSPGPASSRPVVATPEPSPASSPIKSPGVNVRFSKNAEGKVGFVAQDVAKEKREEERQEQAVVQEASWEEFKKQEEALKSLVAREREDNDYTRLVEPPSAEPTDRFGVRLPPKPVPQTERLDRTFNFDGWERSDAPKTAPVETQPPAGRGRGGAASSGASTARGRGAASTAARTTTPPPRGRGGRVQAPPPPRPVAPPTPSSLLLTSVMKRPLEPTHPADNLILLSDEINSRPSGSNSAVVLGHRKVGFGVGCLDIIHSSSEGDDSDDSEDSDSDV